MTTVETRREEEAETGPSSRAQQLVGELRTDLDSRGPHNENVIRNRELLLSQETNGQALRAWYDAAIKRFPELAEVKIVAKPTGEIGASARSKYASNNKSGYHEIHIRLDAGSEEELHSAVQARSVAQRAADLLGISDPADITPQKFQAFIMLHEIGHTLDYMRNLRSPEDYLKRKAARKAELDTLPIPGVRGEKLRDPVYQQALLDLNPDLFTRLGVRNFDEVIALQERAYRDTPMESYADQLAAAVMTGKAFTR